MAAGQKAKVGGKTFRSLVSFQFEMIRMIFMMGSCPLPCASWFVLVSEFPKSLMPQLMPGKSLQHAGTSWLLVKS